MSLQKIFSDFLVGRSTRTNCRRFTNSTTYHVKMDVRNGILRPCVTSFGMKNILEIPNGRNITPRILFRSTAKSMPEKSSTTGQRERIRQSFQSRNTNWRKNCWKADRNRVAKRHNKAYPLRQKVYCGSCGSVFRRKGNQCKLFTGYA